MATLDDDDIEKLSQVFLKGLDGRRSIPEDVHKNHHNIVIPKMVTYIDAEIEKKKTRAQRIEKIKTTIIGGTLTAIVVGAGTALYHWFEFVAKLVHKSNGGH